MLDTVDTFCTENAPRHILIVDDEPSIRSSLQRLLADIAEAQDVSILTAAGTDEALQLIETWGEQIMVLVTDLRMPKRSGVTLIQDVHRLAPLTTCIVLTGYADFEEIQRAIEVGIFSYEVKPWDNDRIRQTITQALDHAQAIRDRECRSQQLETELRWAGELQQKLLESDLPNNSELSFGVRYRPLPWLSCGGDYYDIIPFGPSSVIALIGDVAGHGIQAAFVTAILKSMIYRGYIRPALQEGFSPGAFLSWLNEQFLREFQAIPDLILTFSATLIDLSARTITTACAGHEPLYILRHGECLVLDERGPAIGIADAVEFGDQHAPLHAGDVLTLLTDGVTEYPRKNNKLSSDQITRLIREHPRAATGLDAFIDACHNELEMTAQQDDVTVLKIGISQ
ncbi:MAG: PP2C family protein-serine/threonine phosphatase [Alkalispirochaeta sp.]